MKTSLLSLFAFCLGLNVVLSPAACRADDVTPPVVAKPIADFTVPAGTASSKVKLKTTFALSGVTGEIARFTTSMGNIDVQLRADVAPNTVANFLGYVSSGAYNNSFFHRSVSDFIIQGGGYDVVNGQVESITAGSPVVNEYNLSNTRGTLAMAKLGDDPNSATDEWFFNEADNSANLNNQNGGFTVFGSIIEDGLSVMDAIGALTIVDASGGDSSSPFSAVPVLSSYQSGTSLAISDLVMVSSIQVVPLVPKAQGDVALLKLKVKGNTNPGLVTPTISGKALTLAYTPGVTGSATITVMGKNAATKSKAATSFTVTVQ